jgi:hypothetical protein
MTDADEQLRYLRAAAAALGDHLEANPHLTGIAGTMGEAFARADHLVACVSAVDAMCCAGTLPAEWRPPKSGG